MINKSMRRLFAILLSALIMLSAVIPAVAAEDESSAPAGNSQTITEESKDESKTEDLVVEEPEDEEPKDEEPEDEEPKDEEPKAEEPKDEEPKDEEPKDEEPKAEEPKDEEVKAEEVKDEEPKDEEPKDEEPKDEEPKAEEAEVEEPKDEEPKDEEKAFADLTIEEQYAALKEMSDEEIEATFSQLNEDQIRTLMVYAESVEPREIPQTVVFTNAGPFMPAVTVPTARRRLAKTGNTKSSPDDPLQLDKQFTDNGDDTYTITLESYTTGDVISHEISTPVDIVLVLDQSGSMAYGFDGESASYANSRQKAMKDAVESFLNNVKEKYSESADHRVSIVTFGSSASNLVGWTAVDSDGYDILFAAVDGLPPSPSGATNVGAGMGRAQHLVTVEFNYTGTNTERQKVVIVFTDGIPTTQTDFSTGVANGALNAGKNIKDAGATVYTVGIFNGADPSQLHGDKWDYVAFWHSDIICTGEEGSYWGGSWVSSFIGNNDFDALDVPAGNRFLNYLSSNSPNAMEIGIKKGTYNPGDYLLAGGTGWRIDTNSSCDTSKGYYLTAGDSSSLKNVFQSIAEQIATPAIDLGSETIVKDIISPQLQIPEGATVKYYTQPYNGGGNWGTRTEVTDGSIHVVSGSDPKTVSVIGFDYNANCVTEEGRDGFYGKKLIIEIIVETDPNFLGGTIDTNGPNSGIYPAGSDTPVGTFDVPTNPFRMKQISPESATRNIYLSTEDQLASTFSDLKFTIGSNTVDFDDLFNGINNAGVDYELRIKDEEGNVVGIYKIPAGKTPSDSESGWQGGEAPTLGAQAYTIDSIVSDKTCPPWDPRLDPDSPEHDPNAPQPQIMQGHIDLNVFKPILTYADKNVYYKGTQINVASVTPTVEWKCGDTLDSAAEGGMVTTEPPTLTYTYSGVTGTTVDQTTDYTVEVTAVKNGEVDLLTTYPEGSVTFKRDCSVESLTGAAATAAEAFKIHVYTPAFTFNDDVKYYGEAYTLPTVDINSIEWKNGTTAAPSPMDNAVPAITVALTPDPATAFDDGYVQVTTDVPVKAVITLGGTDVTAALITAGKITRTCTPEVCETVPAATADTAFVVHVKTVSLTIKKSIEGAYADKTKTYSFNVSYSGNVNYSFAESTFTLGHDGKKKLTGLPVGSVTVEESGVLEGYTVAFEFNSVKGNPKTPSEGKASESLNLTAGTKENTVIVHNTLTTVPETGISLNDGMSSALLLMIALGGMAAMAVLSVVKRFSGRVKPVRK